MFVDLVLTARHGAENGEPFGVVPPGDRGQFRVASTDFVQASHGQ
jgi:hypothetical protein